MSAFKNVPKAEAQRILEKRAQAFKSDGKYSTDEFNKALSENYGHAGPVFVRHVLRNKELVKNLVSVMQRKIDEKNGLIHENRFWSAFCAVSVVGCMIANKCGLLSYDPATVMREAAILIQENRANLNSINKSTTDTLNEYVNENWNNILKLKSTDDLRVSGSNPVGLETLVVPTAQPRQHLVARYETDTKIICLLPKPLKEWCIRQHINYASFTADMQAGLGAVRKKSGWEKGQT